MVIESPAAGFWYIVLHYRGNWQWFWHVISAPWIPLPQVSIFSAKRLSIVMMNQLNMAANYHNHEHGIKKESAPIKAEVIKGPYYRNDEVLI